MTSYNLTGFVRENILGAMRSDEQAVVSCGAGMTETITLDGTADVISRPLFSPPAPHKRHFSYRYRVLLYNAALTERFEERQESQN